MDPRAIARRLGGDAGFASLQFVVAAGLAMFMVVGLTQLIAYQYARGAVMAALERGVRAGSVAGAGAAECEAAVVDSLSEVLGGEVGASLSFGCLADADLVSGWAEGTVPAWMAGAPSLPFEATVVATREPIP